MIAYRQLDDKVKEKVDELVAVLQRDYPHVNHFAAMGPWPDDLKADGVTLYNTMHYTNIPYNPQGVALPPIPKVNIVWAIGEALKVLDRATTRPVDKARELAFLTHFCGDIHQPLHSTTYYNNDLPAGNIGGNAFPIASYGKWRNLHACWDDGCGYLSTYNDINPYGDPKEPLSASDLERLNQLADVIMAAHPEESLREVWILDADFWALESHKLAIRYGYKGVQKVDESGRKTYVKPNDALSEYYLAQGMEVVEKRLALGGYRLAALLNEVFAEEE